MEITFDFLYNNGFREEITENENKRLILKTNDYFIILTPELYFKNRNCYRFDVYCEKYKNNEIISQMTVTHVDTVIKLQETFNYFGINLKLKV